MPVKSIDANSMFDVYKQKMLDIAQTLKPGPSDDEIADVSQQKDNSFDDFEDVNDDMLGTVYQLVSQYEKMGGQLRLDGAKMKGGVLTEDDDKNYMINLKSPMEDIIAKLNSLNKKYKDETGTSAFWSKRSDYFGDLLSDEGNGNNRKQVIQKIKNLEKIIEENYKKALNVDKKTQDRALERRINEIEGKQAQYKRDTKTVAEWDDELKIIEEEIKAASSPLIVNKLVESIKVIEKMQTLAAPPKPPPPIPSPPNKYAEQSKGITDAFKGTPEKEDNKKVPSLKDVPKRPIKKGAAEEEKQLPKSTQTFLNLTDKKRDGNVIRKWIRGKTAEVKDVQNPMQTDDMKALKIQVDNAKKIEKENYESKTLQEQFGNLSELISQTLKKKNDVVTPVPQAAIPSNSLEKEFKIELGKKAADVDEVVQILEEMLKTIKNETGNSDFWKARKLVTGNLEKVEENDTTNKLKRPRAKVTEVFKRIDTALDNKIDLAMQSEQSTQQTTEAESRAQEAVAKVEQVEAKREETENQLTTAKSLFSETGNTSIGALLGVIVKVINKMIRLVKLKRDEWRSSVPMNDLNDVRKKVVEYFNKFNEINPADRVMKSYKDSYALANKKFNEIHDEFEQLVKTTNLNTQIYGGQIYGGCRCKFKDADEPYIFPGKM